jgi:hypothetical protein
MKRVVITFGLLGFYAIYAQCNSCTISGSPVLPNGFNPSSITLFVGQDLDVEIQFTLPDTADAGGLSIYPNYAIFVDSLRMASGTTYVVLQGTANTPVSYNTSNPANGALRFDQSHRYKQVESSPNVFANVVVYRNPSPSEAGVGSGQLSPPRGCVRACLRGKAPTPTGTGDSLYIWIRAFVDPNSISLFPSPSSTDISNKDTTNLMPELFSMPLYADTSLYYGPVIVRATTSVLHSAVLGGLSLSPNPAWGVATVRFQVSYPVQGTLRAMDLAGRVVYERDLGLLPVGEQSQELRLPAGTYIVELQTGEEVYRNRLVVVE